MLAVVAGKLLQMARVVVATEAQLCIACTDSKGAPSSNLHKVSYGLSMALMTSIAYNTRALLLAVWPMDQPQQHHLGARWKSKALCPTPDLLDLHFDEIQVTCAH